MKSEIIREYMQKTVKNGISLAFVVGKVGFARIDMEKLSIVGQRFRIGEFYRTLELGS
jgi:hypothetical protein